MYFTNQQTAMGNGQLTFVPVSKMFSNVGSTVSYAMAPLTAANSMNSNLNQISGLQQQSWFNNSNNMLWQNQQQINARNFPQYPTASFSNSQFIQPQTYCLKSSVVQPSIDISETASDVVVTACVSNIGINNMNLNVTDNSVTISGTAWTGSDNIVLNRTVPLPTSIHAESVEANFQSGVLEIRCPKFDKAIRQRTTLNSDSIQMSQQMNQQ